MKMSNIWSKIDVIVIPAILVIALVLFFFFIRPSMSYFQSVLDKYLEENTVQLRIELAERDRLIKAQNEQLEQLVVKYKVSLAAYTKTKNDLEKLKKEAININEPKNAEEVKIRLRNLGYTVR